MSELAFLDIDRAMLMNMVDDAAKVFSCDCCIYVHGSNSSVSPAWVGLKLLTKPTLYTFLKLITKWMIPINTISRSIFFFAFVMVACAWYRDPYPDSPPNIITLNVIF